MNLLTLTVNHSISLQKNDHMEVYLSLVGKGISTTGRYMHSVVEPDENSGKIVFIAYGETPEEATERAKTIVELWNNQNK